MAKNEMYSYSSSLVADYQFTDFFNFEKNVFVFHFFLFVFGGPNIKGIQIQRDINISQILERSQTSSLSCCNLPTDQTIHNRILSKAVMPLHAE